MGPLIGVRENECVDGTIERCVLLTGRVVRVVDGSNSCVGVTIVVSLGSFSRRIPTGRVG